MKDLNRLISSSEMDLTHDDSSPVDSDISVNTLNGELEVSLCVVCMQWVQYICERMYSVCTSYYFLSNEVQCLAVRVQDKIIYSFILWLK